MMKKISLILLAAAVAFGSAFAENFKYGNFGGSIEASKKAGYDGYLIAELSAMPKTPEYLYESTVKALDTILAM